MVPSGEKSIIPQGLPFSVTEGEAGAVVKQQEEVLQGLRHEEALHEVVVLHGNGGSGPLRPEAIAN